MNPYNRTKPELSTTMHHPSTRRALPAPDARPSAVRQYLEAIFIERYEMSPSEAVEQASAWKYGDGQELRSAGGWNDPSSPGKAFRIFGDDLGGRLQEYVMETWLEEWRLTDDARIARRKISQRADYLAFDIADSYDPTIWVRREITDFVLI